MNKITNRTHKAHVDWLNQSYTQWECEGCKVESQCVVLHLTFKPHLSQFDSSDHRRAINDHKP